MVGKVGNDAFGKQLINTVSQAGVDTGKILISEKSHSAVGNIWIENKDGNATNRICVVPGANMDITPNDVLFLQEEIANYDMVMLQFEIPMQINTIIAKYAAQKGVPVMLNTAPYAPIPKEMLSYITYISPNEHEASAISGIDVCDVESAAEAIKVITDMGIKNVLITLGKRGAVIGDKDSFFVLSFC